MTVIKRDRNSTNTDLIIAIEKLTGYLLKQDEDDAVNALNEATGLLRRHQPGTAEHRRAIDLIIDAFEGEHELMAYTFQRDTKEWTEVEELSNASSRVISLARRMRS